MTTRANPEPEPRSKSDIVEVETPEPVPQLPFFIAGIGASAGGLEALEEFFSKVEPGHGVAYVVIQHLSPDFKSMMSQLLPRHTALRVTEAEHDTVPTPDRVYLLPAKKVMRLKHGRFHLTEREHTYLPRPINVFFESLAQEQGDQCAVIVLSGTGTDGTHGARIVKEAGGLVLAQEPASAKFDGMPNSLIAAGIADLVLPPPELAERIRRYVTHPVLGESKPQATDEEAAVTSLVQALRRSTGVNFNHYKRGTMWRRIQRRTSLLGHSTIKDYAGHAEEDGEEVDALAREVLIGVTQFFRDGEVWHNVEQNVLPVLIEKAEPHDCLRVWSAGCATGEEAYTLAMLVDSQIAAQKKPLTFRLFATDARRDALSFARRGIYPEAACGHIPDRFRNRYFEKDGELLIARRALRDNITFAPHNLLADPPFTRLDLACCRNLLIYLVQEAQRQVLGRLHSSLLEGGFLLLGSSETVSDAAGSLFQMVPGKGPLFRCLPADARPIHTPAALRDAQVRASIVASQGSAAKAAPLEPVYEAVLSRYVPPGVAVDAKFDIVQVFGRVPAYVNLPAGRLTVNLLRMVPQPLGVLLNSAGRKALTRHEEVRIPGVSLPDSERQLVDVRVIPTRALPGVDKGLLVFFESGEAARNEGTTGSDSVDDATQQRLCELEDELVVTRENLHAAVQDLEATNEELQATNEEMTASNEELQSTNEELQSVNEELYSVNAEYQQKISELEELYSDLETLLASIDAGVLFLDGDLKIRRYNEATTRLLPVRREDVGRPIREIAFQATYPELEADVRAVLEGDTSNTRELIGHDGSWWMVSIRPFRDQRVDTTGGIIMTFRDISVVRQAGLKARRWAASHEMAAELVGVGHAVVDLDDETVEFSAGAKALLGLPLEAPVSLPQLVAELGEEPESADKLFSRLKSGEAVPFAMTRTVSLSSSAPVKLRISVRPEREPDTGHRVILFAFVQAP